MTHYRNYYAASKEKKSKKPGRTGNTNSPSSGFSRHSLLPLVPAPLQFCSIFFPNFFFSLSPPPFLRMFFLFLFLFLFFFFTFLVRAIPTHSSRLPSSPNSEKCSLLHITLARTTAVSSAASLPSPLLPDLLLLCSLPTSWS